MAAHDWVLSVPHTAVEEVEMAQGRGVTHIHQSHEVV
jgi:hypothetical protein